jgi:hypothetical protein
MQRYTYHTLPACVDTYLCTSRLLRVATPAFHEVDDVARAEPCRNNSMRVHTHPFNSDVPANVTASAIALKHSAAAFAASSCCMSTLTTTIGTLGSHRSSCVSSSSPRSCHVSYAAMSVSTKLNSVGFTCAMGSLRPRCPSSCTKALTAFRWLVEYLQQDLRHGSCESTLGYYTAWTSRKCSMPLRAVQPHPRIYHLRLDCQFPPGTQG